MGDKTLTRKEHREMPQLTSHPHHSALWIHDFAHTLSSAPTKYVVLRIDAIFAPIRLHGMKASPTLVARYLAASLKNAAILVVTVFLTLPLSGLAQTAGTLDPAYNPMIAGGYPNAMAMQADGKMIVGGNFTTVGGVSQPSLVRLNTDGTVDSSFVAVPNGTVAALAVQSDGKILVAGAFNSINGTPRFRFARLHSDGSVESTATFLTGQNGPNSSVSSISLQPDGKIFVTGDFTTFYGVARPHLVRLEANGTLESTATFDLGTGPNAYVSGVAIQEDGKLVVVGNFTAINGTSINRIARLSSSGAVESSATFNPGTGPNSTVYGVIVQPDGKILIKGDFVSYDGSLSRARITRLNADGSFESAATFSMGNPPTTTMQAMILQADGKIVIGGNTPTVNGITVNGLARLNSNGSLETTATFNPGTEAGTFITGLAAQADGKIIVAGGFTSIAGTPRNNIARLRNDTAVQTLTATNATQLDWLRSGSTPEVSSVAFARSTDGGTSWTPLGNGVRIAGGWRITGLTLLGSGMVRAHGRVTGGFGNGSAGLIEQTTTFNFATAPLVSSPTSTDITKATATLGGTVTADGGAAIIERGIVFSATNTNANPEIGGGGVTKLTSSGTTGTFTVSATSLTASTGYSFKAYATNSIGTTYTSVSTFTTLAPLPGTLALGSTFLIVNESAGTVNIPIVRTLGADGIVGFTITTTDGTATVGSDFTAPTASQTLGDSIISLNIPIPLVTPGLDEPNESFTVTLSAPTGGATLGANVSATVFIVDSKDTSKPSTPTIAAPTVGTLNLPGAIVNVTGTAKDNKGISAVKVKLNGGAFVDAVLTPMGTNATYTLPITPISGLNTLVVQSFDTSNTASTAVTRTFTIARPLTVNLAGSGTVTVGYPGLSYRLVGTSYTVTAKALTTPAPGFVFDGWTVNNTAGTGITPAKQELPALTFVFQEGLVLTANFIANPFAAVAGTYNGLVKSHPAQVVAGGGFTVPSVSTEGSFTAQVQPSGGFTGKFLLDGLSIPVSGSLDNTGVARFGPARTTSVNLPRPNRPVGSMVASLFLDLLTPGINDRITGLVTQYNRVTLTAASLVSADRAGYNGLTPATTVPDVYLTVSGPGNTIKKDGIFTAILPSKGLATQPAGFSVNDYPQGSGFATVKVSKAGLVTLAVTLADSITPVTASTTLSKNNTWPLFVQLNNKLGCLSAQVTLDNTQPGTDMSATDALWFRPQLNAQYYPYGWPEGIKVDLRAAKYSATTGQSALLAANGAPLPAPAMNGNARLTFGSGLLSALINRNLNLTITDTVTKLAPLDFTLTVKRPSGIIGGTFTHTNGSKPTYQGIIYQKGPAAGVYGFFLTPKPKVMDYLGVSGYVTLFAQ